MTRQEFEELAAWAEEAHKMWLDVPKWQEKWKAYPVATTEWHGPVRPRRSEKTKDIQITSH